MRCRSVCYNLARLSSVGAKEPEDIEPIIPPAAPLRRPRSPVGAGGESPRVRDDDSASDRATKFQQKTGQQKTAQRLTRGRNPARENGQDKRDSHERRDNQEWRDNNERRDNQEKRDNRRSVDNETDQDGAAKRTRKPHADNKRPSRQIHNYRFDRHQHFDEEEEYWDDSSTKPDQSDAKPVREPKVQRDEPKEKPNTPLRARLNKERVPVATAVKESLPVKPLPEKPLPVKEPVAKENGVKPPLSVTEATPAKKLVPKQCVIETLSVGETVLLSVDAVAADCRISESGFVCLSMHERHEAGYQALCDKYGDACDNDTDDYTPSPGESFSYFNPEDAAWYRARCLSASSVALLDSSKVVGRSDGDKARRLNAPYDGTPEFSCVLRADGVEIGDSLQCTVVEKTPGGCVVQVQKVGSSGLLGDGQLARWTPRVDYPAPAPAPAPAPTAQAVIPEVPRPDVSNGSKVLLVELSELDKAFVRPADTASLRQYDDIVQVVVHYGLSAPPLEEPPQKGSVVVAKFPDGHHYRALVKRTNAKQNKYLLENIEYGTVEIGQLENLCPCPSRLGLSSRPPLTSQVALHGVEGSLAPPAVAYADKIKETEELVLSIPSGSKTAPSGSGVTLTLTRTGENLNRTLEDMCKPDWKKLEARGGDALEAETLMFSELEYVQVPKEGCELEVLDFGTIDRGAVSGCPKGLPHAKHVFGPLTEQMEEYCNSAIGREPYLPKDEELCLAQCPPYPQWFRAVKMEQAMGAGGAECTVCFVDYGNVAEVSTSAIRKLPAEFARGLPALGVTFELRDFPKNPTPAMLQKAIEHLNINEEGRGSLRLTNCLKEEDGMYVADAPELAAAMKNA